MKKSVIVWIILLISYLGLVIYANRALYTTRFDESYWKDKYEHSQWKLPLSSRTMGDDGLYLYEGYRIIKGGDPTLLNAEVPPLGKYLIGATILLTQNAFVYGLWTIILLLLFVFMLAKTLFRSTNLALITTLLLATDPLIANQYALTMLDGLQATMFVLFLLILFHLPRTRSMYLVISSGVILGLFSETKAPILSPIIATFGLIYIWRVVKKPYSLAWFLVSVVLGYMLPYFPYFLQDHSILDWLRVQKWIASFYINGNITPTWGSAIAALISGRFQNIFSRVWEVAPQWSPLWAFMLVSIVGTIFRKRPVEWRAVGTLFLCILGLFTVIPFWTRYFVVVLPLLYLFGTLALSQLPARFSVPLIIGMTAINLISSYPILFPSPTPSANQYIHNAENQFFADLYEDLTAKTKRSVTRDAFRRFGLTTMADGHIARIELAPKNIPTGKTSPQYLTATATYYTRELGSFTQDVTIPFVLEDNRWKIPWDWSHLLPGLTSTTHLVTTVIPARRGSILASDKSPLASDGESFLVSVIPGKVDPTTEQKMFVLLEHLFGSSKPAVYLHQRIYGNSLSDVGIPLGVLPMPIAEEAYIQLTQFRGVDLTAHIGRLKGKSDIVTIGDVANTHFFECCSYLYSTTTYDGINGVELAKNSQLKGINGGSLVLKDAEGTVLKTYINREKVDGKNVEP